MNESAIQYLAEKILAHLVSGDIPFDAIRRNIDLIHRRNADRIWSAVQRLSVAHVRGY